MSGGIPPLCGLASKGNNNQMEKATRLLISIAVMCDEPTRAAITTSGGVPPIVNTLANGNAADKEQAANALWQLSGNTQANPSLYQQAEFQCW